MAIALGAHTQIAVTANGGTSAAISTVGASLIIISYTQYDGVADITPTDSLSNTWIGLTPHDNTAPGFTGKQHIFYAANPIVGASHTFTVALTGSFASAQIAAFTGTDPVSPLAAQNGGITTGTTLSPGPVTPAQNNSLVVTGCGTIGTTGASIDSGFTIIDQTSYSATVFYGSGLAYLIAPSTSSVNPQWTFSASSGAATIAVFNPLATTPIIPDRQWALPVWAKRLPVGGVTAPPVVPVANTIGWLAPLATPQFRKAIQPASGMAAPVSTSPETTTVDRWQQPLSLPVWSKSPRAWAPFLAEPLSQLPETSSLDRWFQPFSLPVRRPARPADNPALFWSGFTTPAPALTSLGWLPSLDVPRRPQLPQPTSGSVGPPSTAPETTTVDRWLAPLSLPVWRRSGVAPYPALSAPPITSDGMGWFHGLVQPLWRRDGGAPYATLSAPPITVADMGWFQGLAQPAPGSGLAVAEQLAVAWGNFVPAAPVVVSLSAWFVNLSTPYPAPMALAAAYQQAYFSYISLEPGTVIPTVIPGSVPGPSDGEDDRRRKWLEWSANRKRKAKVTPAPAIALPPEPAKPARNAKPDILARNVDAVRTQHDTTAVLKAILLAEQQAHAQKIEQETRALALRRQQDDDDDDALSLLMDD